MGVYGERMDGMVAIAESFAKNPLLKKELQFRVRIWLQTKFERTAESRNYPNFSVNQSGHEIAVLFSVMDSQRRIPETDQPIQLPCAVHLPITN